MRKIFKGIITTALLFIICLLFVNFCFSYAKNNEDAYEESNLKTIIVLNNDIEDSKAIRKKVLGAYTILNYDSIAKAENAYNYLTQKGIDVSYNETTELAESADLENLSWSSNYNGINNFRNYITKYDKKYNQNYVAVIDTGIDTDHPLLKNRIAFQYAKSYSTINNSGYDFEDFHGHGTHVSGIIASSSPNSTKIIPIKVDFGTNADTKKTLEAFYYCLDLKKKGVNLVAINCSFIHKTTNNLYQAIIDELYANGIITVAATGNDNTDIRDISPANVINAITVAGIQEDTNNGLIKYNNSNYGEGVDVCAPAYKINSSIIGGSFGLMSGTSMAAPHITAMIAFINSIYPTLTVEKLEQKLYESCIDLGAPGYDMVYGYGFPSFERLINQVSIDSPVLNISSANNEFHFNDKISIAINPPKNYSNYLYKIYYNTNCHELLSTSSSYVKPLTISKSTYIKYYSVLYDSKGTVIGSSKERYIKLIKDNQKDNEIFVIKNNCITQYTSSFPDVIFPNEIDGIKIKSISVAIFTNTHFQNIKTSQYHTPLDAQYDLQSFETPYSSLYITDCINLKHLKANNITQLSNNSLKGSYYIEKIDAPNVKTICIGALKNRTKLIELTCLSNPLGLEDYALYNCCNLVFPDSLSLKSIGEHSLYGCSGLNKVILNSSIITIPKYAFYNSSLCEINLTNIVEIKDYAFYDTKLESINLKEIRDIGYNAFNTINTIYFLNKDYRLINKQNNSIPQSNINIYSYNKKAIEKDFSNLYKYYELNPTITKISYINNSFLVNINSYNSTLSVYESNDLYLDSTDIIKSTKNLTNYYNGEKEIPLKIKDEKYYIIKISDDLLSDYKIYKTVAKVETKNNMEEIANENDNNKAVISSTKDEKGTISNNNIIKSGTSSKVEIKNTSTINSKEKETINIDSKTNNDMEIKENNATNFKTINNKTKFAYISISVFALIIGLSSITFGFYNFKKNKNKKSNH